MYVHVQYCTCTIRWPKYIGDVVRIVIIIRRIVPLLYLQNYPFCFHEFFDIYSLFIKKCQQFD